MNVGKVKVKGGACSTLTATTEVPLSKALNPWSQLPGVTV